jgi:transcriptional regulator GlxA family with amidase domain
MKLLFANNSHASAWTRQRPRAVHVRELVRSHASNGQSPEGSPHVAGQFDVTTRPKIGIIVFQHMVAADLMWPAETFFRSMIPTDNAQYRQCYRVITIGVNTEDCVTESGIIVKPQVDMQHAPPLDTLILPGGSGLHDARLGKKVGKWLSGRAPATRRIATLGSGIYAMAATGLLDGRQVTTHWRLAKDIAAQFPKLRVNPNCLFVKDGPFYTSAGATASIDLALSLIEEDYGTRVALAAARELVVYLKRSGGQEQYSEALRFQTQSVSRLSELATWILSHLNENLTVEALASRACLCLRHFRRRFKSEFGTTPADFVEIMRLDEACRRLSIGDNRVEHVGTSVGFKSADSFRRAFKRRFGVAPGDYRECVNKGPNPLPRPHQRRDLRRLSKAA